MIGITERGDAALDLSWVSWVESKKPAILITKDPSKLFFELYRIKNYYCLPSFPNVIVHCTITGFGGSIIEPNVPTPFLSFKGLEKLIDLIGIRRIVLRIDPIVPTLKGEKTALEIFEKGKKIHSSLRVRISFIDNYKHVKERFKSKGIEPLQFDFHAPLSDRKRIWNNLGNPEICGEPEMECTGCISKIDCKILEVQEEEQINNKQRFACKCLSLKKELLSNRKRCFHQCLYCYWKD